MSFAASRVAHAIRNQAFPVAGKALTKPVLNTSSRAYAAKSNSTRPRAPAASTSPSPSQAERMGATTSAAELHPLPNSVKEAGEPSTGSQQPSFDASGNSTSAVDHSSRPAGPGPSAPPVDPSVAAPRTRGNNGGSERGSSSGKALYSTSAQAGSTEAPLPTLGSDWATSFEGMSTQPFPKEVSEILEAPINEDDIEVKPDGLLYLPEIKYRRILNKAFGPGGWGLAPRTETNVGDKIVSREWALICLGRFVSTARGEQEYFDPSGVATASEGAKSNALMRCCKDLGIAHELWSPRFIRSFKDKKCTEVFVEHATTHKKKKLWRRKDAPHFEYPWKESK